jgi:hypothetical protein
VWDLPSGKLLGQYQADTDPAKGGHVAGLVSSPDSRTFASLHRDNRIRVWEVATRSTVCELPRSGSPLAFFGSGRFLASQGSAGVQLWDLATGQEVGRLEGHDGPVVSLAAGPDGKALISAGSDHTLLVWDLTSALQKGGVAPAPLTDKQLDDLWGALGSPDAAKAYRAVWALVRAPKHSVPRLRESLGKAAETVDAKRIAQLIKDLDDKEFNVREAASRELERLGDRAEPALRKAFDNPPSPEVKRRAENLLGKLDPSILSESRLRAQRAFAVLEHVGDADATAALRKLADGPEAASETREAKAALQRVKARQGDR